MKRTLEERIDMQLRVLNLAYSELRDYVHRNANHAFPLDAVTARDYWILRQAVTREYDKLYALYTEQGH